MENVRIGHHEIGENEKCFIIAEAGVNHNGDISLAKEMIDAAKFAGADAIKFQTFKSEGVTTSTTNMAKYQVKNLGKSETQIEMLKKLELDYDAFFTLKEYCVEKDIIFLSTPHSFDAIDFLDQLVEAHKIGSGDLTNIPAIEHIAEKGKPVIISSGMGTVEEIKEAIAAIRNKGNEKIILMQCVTNYPSAVEHQNIRTIETLGKEFDVLMGYSDHTMGMIASIVAVALGACVIEKHFTLDRNLPGPDQKASMEPSELADFIDSLRKVKLSIGDGKKRPTKDEEETRRIARKSLVAGRNIPKGVEISREMIEIKRPETGLRPKLLREIIGKKTKREIKADEVIVREMIEW